MPKAESTIHTASATTTSLLIDRNCRAILPVRRGYSARPSRLWVWSSPSWWVRVSLFSFGYFDYSGQVLLEVQDLEERLARQEDQGEGQEEKGEDAA